jgi:hypothetical protein
MILHIRHHDKQGSGDYYAPRGGRRHNGIDIINNGGRVVALSDGSVTRIGYPYPPSSGKGHYRYIQITDKNGVHARYFYVSPSVRLGDNVKVAQGIGCQQDLTCTYPGIINHFHFEVLLYINGKKVFLNPEQYLKAYGHDIT